MVAKVYEVTARQYLQFFSNEQKVTYYINIPIAFRPNLRVK